MSDLTLDELAERISWLARRTSERFAEADPDLVERLSARVHQAWINAKQAEGVMSRPHDNGEEQMVPYDDLSEQVKELDRNTVRAVLRALAEEDDRATFRGLLEAGVIEAGPAVLGEIKPAGEKR